MTETYPRSALVTQLLIRRVAEFDVPHSLETCERLIRAHYPEPRPSSWSVLFAIDWLVWGRAFEVHGKTLRYAFSTHRNNSVSLQFEATATGNPDATCHIRFTSESRMFAAFTLSIIPIVILLTGSFLNPAGSAFGGLFWLFFLVVWIVNLIIARADASAQQGYRLQELRYVLR